MDVKTFTKSIKVNKSKLKAASPVDIKEENRPNAAVLKALVEYYGGNTKCAEMLSDILGEDIFPATLMNWKIRGTVPIKMVFKIAAAFDISPYALNYHGVLELTNEAPSWASIVKSIARFSDKDIANLIRMGKQFGFG